MGELVCSGEGEQLASAALTAATTAAAAAIVLWAKAVLQFP